MSTNKFWFRNQEALERIKRWLTTEFKVCDNFMTIYQLEAFSKSEDSEFITSEKNKDLGFTLEEFNDCDRVCLTTLPSQYELYFKVQPHDKEKENSVDLTEETLMIKCRTIKAENDFIASFNKTLANEGNVFVKGMVDYLKQHPKDYTVSNDLNDYMKDWIGWDKETDIFKGSPKIVCVKHPYSLEPYRQVSKGEKFHDKLVFASEETFKTLRAVLDPSIFYTVSDLYKVINANDLGPFTSVHVSDKTNDDLEGWDGDVLINALDQNERINIDTDCWAKGGFYIFIPDPRKKTFTSVDDPGKDIKEFFDNLDDECSKTIAAEDLPNGELTPEEIVAAIKEYKEKYKRVDEDSYGKSGKPTRQYILERAIETCCHDRQDQYGSPENSFRAIAYLWDDYIELKYPEIPKKTAFCFTREDVSIMMALMKIARQMYGQGKMDNFVDASSYMAIAGEMWSEGQKK